MKVGLLALCVLPLSALGQSLTVRYEGTVYWADDGAPYEIGDSVSGTLLIDRLLLGPDLYPLDPDRGAYGADLPSLPTANFVTGFATGVPANDSLYIGDDFQHLNGVSDTYQILDQSGFGTSSFMHLVLAGYLPSTTFADDDVSQTFEAVSQALGDLVGTLAWGWEASRRQVDFYLSRLSVKADRCVP
jgi:hypothetical protein